MKHLYNGYGLQEMKAKFGFAANKLYCDNNIKEDFK